MRGGCARRTQTYTRCRRRAGNGQGCHLEGRYGREQQQRNDLHFVRRGSRSHIIFFERNGTVFRGNPVCGGEHTGASTTICGQPQMAAAVGRHHSAAVGDDGALFVWGHDGNGQLGTGDTANRLARTRIAGLPAHVRQVAAGDFHTGIVTEAGDLLMCGYGRDGRLGLGDEDDRTTPTLVARAVFDGEAVLMVACGEEHTAAVTWRAAASTPLGLGFAGSWGTGMRRTSLRRGGCRRRCSTASGS